MKCPQPSQPDLENSYTPLGPPPPVKSQTDLENSYTPFPCLGPRV